MPRWLAFTLFVVVFLSVWLGGNYFLASRLILDLQLPAGIENVLIGAMVVVVLLPLVHPIVERTGPPPLVRLVSWPANLWIGVAFYLLLSLLLTDLVLLLLGAASSSPLDGPGIARGQALVVVLITSVLVALSLISGLAQPRVRRTEVELPHWPTELDGFQIVQISDVHIDARFGASFARWITEQVNSLAPDLIAVTGDLVDGSTEHLASEVAPFAELSAPHGVFFVSGNHDYYSGIDPWLAHVQSLGMRPLRNERVEIHARGASFDLAGVDDHRANLFGPDHGEDVERALAGRDRSRAVVLLAHDPTTFHAAHHHGIDLQLSGHTHGGQIWPFGYLVRLAVGFVAGHYRRGDSQLLVSCGTGVWGPPMRLRADAEISQIVLRRVAVL